MDDSLKAVRYAANYAVLMRMLIIVAENVKRNFVAVAESSRTTLASPANSSLNTRRLDIADFVQHNSSQITLLHLLGGLLHSRTVAPAKSARKKDHMLAQLSIRYGLTSNALIMNLSSRIELFIIK
jgi:hypothetical protein